MAGPARRCCRPGACGATGTDGSTSLPSPPLSPSDRHAGAPPAELPPKLVPVDLPPTLVALDLPPTLSAVNLSSCSLNSHRPRQPAPLRQCCT